MEWILYALIASSVGLVIYSLRQLRRNNLVYRFRCEVADQVSEAAHADIERDVNSNWKLRYDILHQVSYDEMLDSFKPLRIESFWSEEEICKMLHTKHPDGACNFAVENTSLPQHD